jgi:hypothetical protein
MANAGCQLQGERASLNGLDAYVGTYQGAMQGLGNVVTMAAHIVHNRNVYMFAASRRPTSSSPRNSPSSRASARSGS